MKIKELIKRDAGFLYVVDNMEFMSSAGRRMILNSDMMTDPKALTTEWDRLNRVIEASQNDDNKKAYTDLRHCLMQLHDLKGTLASLAAHTTLDEVELFEIKNLAFLNSKAATALTSMHLDDVLPLPCLSEVASLLDPDHTGIANFYIYDSYDVRLTPLRRELKVLQEHDGDALRISQLLSEQNDIQQQVCLRLSDLLSPHCQALTTALEQMAYTDYLLAKSDLALRWSLTRPTLGDTVSHTQLFNPRLRDHNEQAGLRYQPVSLTASHGVTLITGANMAGKTVLLKSVGTAQMMIQCGFYAPSEASETMLFDDIVSSIGDDQDEMNGLSSYASEIVNISDILRRCHSERLLILIDEPARTTNPVEGKALVQALLTLLQQTSSVSLVTTHYSGLGTACRRLRVRGFMEDMVDIPLNPRNINRFIDYSLTEDQNDNVPHEALRIAEILGCDKDLTSLAKDFIAQ